MLMNPFFRKFSFDYCDDNHFAGTPQVQLSWYYLFRPRYRYINPRA